MKLKITSTEIILTPQDSPSLSMPIEWFPKIKNASEEQRQNYEFSAFGIHWIDLDEDLSFEGFKYFKKPMLRDEAV